jgi:hypothetical protein
LIGTGGAIPQVNPPNYYNLNTTNPIVAAFGSPYFFAFAPMLMIELVTLYATKNEFLSIVVFIACNFIFATVSVVPMWLGFICATLGIEIVLLKRDW